MTKDTTGIPSPRRKRKNDYRNEEPSMGDRRLGRKRRLVVPNCAVLDCLRGAICRGLCRTHDQRMRRHGRLDADLRCKDGLAADAKRVG